VEGVRRDIRIANLSLINSEWYIKQLKNQTPYGTDKVAISYDDATIDKLQPTKWEARDITLPVPKEVLEQFEVKDTAITNAGKITFKMNPTLDYGNIKGVRVQDLAVKDIVESNKWKRPIYFAGSCSPDNKIGLDLYLRQEGLAERLVPIRREVEFQNVDLDKTMKDIFEENPGYSKTYARGFKFRGLNDKNIFYDDNSERTLSSYRMSFLNVAQYLLHGIKDNAKCVKVLDRMEEVMPRSVLRMDYRLKYYICNFYLQAGDKPKYQAMAREIEPELLARIKEFPNDISGEYSPYKMITEIYKNLEDYDKAFGILNTILSINPNDKNARVELERLKALINPNK
jgi:hypothetical protein